MPLLAAHYVYHLFEGDELVYVGRSNKPRRRWRACEKLNNTTLRLEIVLGPVSFEIAQAAELKHLKVALPKYNKRVISSTGSLGKTISKEHAARVSAASTHRIAENGSPMLGKRHTDETKKLIGKAPRARYAVNGNQNKGSVRSAEARAACSAGQYKRQERERAARLVQYTEEELHEMKRLRNNAYRAAYVARQKTKQVQS